jgi:hypothetical protein
MVVAQMFSIKPTLADFSVYHLSAESAAGATIQSNL